MKQRIIVLCITLLTAKAHACSTESCRHKETNLSPAQEDYIASHRDRGPEGLQDALDDYQKFLDARKFKGNPFLNRAGFGKKADDGFEQFQARAEARAAEQAEDERWRKVLDTIAAQRGAATSQLYWYTDIEAAKLAADKSDKPILSLRMLGKLTDEYSCANSRFFRTTLYANEKISTALRDRFILHWQSVRPVPKVTIDFGDGRKLERTLTGNSAHYMLTPQGVPVDVLPGLYSPQAFSQWLDQSESLAKSYHLHHVPQQMLVRYHKHREQEVLQAFKNDLASVNHDTAAYLFGLDAVINPDAVDGARVSVAKAAVARPMLRELDLNTERLDRALNDEVWLEIAALQQSREKTKLDESSIALIRAENPQNENPFAAGRLATSKFVVEDPILKLVRQFENSIALDTVKNEYLLHRQIHHWFATGEAPQDFDQLNEKVYAELFLTPSSDPWLGLAPANVYTALEKDGKVAQ